MTAQLDIANMALAHLAVSRTIAAMNEATQAARVMTQFYNQARDETLRDFNWPFARKFAALAQVAAAPTPDWGFSYRYPADCVLVRDVYPSATSRRPLTSAGRVPYIVGQDGTGRLIYASTASLQIEYTIAISEAYWPPDFVAAVSFLLAWYAAPALAAGDPHKLGERARAAYQDAIGRAQLAGENEQEEELSVANLALTHLGVGRPMMSMNEQSRAARAVHQFYAQVRDELFREFNWPFARKFASPTLVAGPSPRASVDWLYSYRYPTDCLYARRCAISRGAPTCARPRLPFSIGQDNTGRLIFTDANRWRLRATGPRSPSSSTRCSSARRCGRRTSPGRSPIGSRGTSRRSWRAATARQLRERMLH
jgi:hypothetical protein